MKNEQFVAAFNSWVLAVVEKCYIKNDELSYQDLARQYGRDITTKKHLEIVSECFDFDKIEKILDRILEKENYDRQNETSI